MLSPKKTKFRKYHKRKIQTLELKQLSIIPFYSNIGLKVLDFGLITAKQLDSATKIIKKSIKKKGKLYTKVFPDVPVTKKPIEVRMGKGKGNVAYWATFVKPGRILFEISGSSLKLAEKALLKGSLKLPLRTQIIKI